MKLRHFLLCFLYIFLAPFVFGQASTIKINEFLIEPTPQIVELLNTGTEIVDLSNWYIDDNGGTSYFTIPSGTEIYPNACISFSGSLNLNRNTEDAIRLFDSTSPPTTLSANLIDSFQYKSSSGSGVTFQRIPDGQSIWATGSANFDRYNLTGLSCKVESTITPTPSSPSAPTITPHPTSVQATPTSTPDIKAIYLSEVYPYPNENETEWVELFNDNEFSVFLDNWKLDDISNGGSTPKKFSITIPGYSFKTIDLASSIFNNDGDDVRLLNTTDTLVDAFSYDDSEKEKSIGRISFSSMSYCLQNSSKERSNNSCINEITILPTPTITPGPTSKPISKNLSGSILGTSIDNGTNDGYEPVRPTQYYERPTIVEDKILEDNMKNNKVSVETSQDDHTVKTVKASALISAVASFLTAGFIFIRIIL